MGFLGGPKAAFGSAVACGILLGVFEGVGVLVNRVFAPPCQFMAKSIHFRED